MVIIVTLICPLCQCIFKPATINMIKGDADCPECRNKLCGIYNIEEIDERNGEDK